MNNKDKKDAIIFLGSPGAGKTTAAEHISSITNATVVKTGKWLRQEVKQNTSLGEQLQPFLDKGELAPSDLVYHILHKNIQKTDSSIIIFDGFPRREEEIPFLDDLKKEFNLRLMAIVFFRISRQIAFQRLIERKRTDDTPELINRRLSIYDEITFPVMRKLKKKHPDFTFEINAQQPWEAVVLEVKLILKLEKAERKNGVTINE